MRTSREDSPWRTPIVEVQPGHAITSAAIREAIRTDRLLRKLQGALSVGVLTSENFHKATTAVRQSLTRFSEQIKQLRTSLPSSNRKQGTGTVADHTATKSAANDGASGKPCPLRIHHPITRAVVAAILDLDRVLREAMFHFAMGTLPRSSYDDLCGVPAESGQPPRQGRAERIVELFGMAVDGVAASVPPHILASRTAGAQSSSIGRFRNETLKQ